MTTPSRVDYDEFRDRYERDLDDAVSFAGKEHEFFTKAKADELVQLVRRHLGAPERLHAVDVGCGVGLTDRHLTRTFGSLTGVDISPGVLEQAKQANPDVRYELASRDRLPFDDDAFDVAFAMCVVQVVPEADRPSFVSELARVTRPGGLVTIFEHNPLNPLTRLVVRRCEFGGDAKMFGRRTAVELLEGSGLEPVDSGYLLLFPSSRSHVKALERQLSRLPLGAQYYVAARTT